MRLVQKTQRLVASGESKEVYRYECPSCQEVFESTSGAGEVVCPACGAGRSPGQSAERG